MKLNNIVRAILLIAILLAGAKLAYALDPPHNATSDPDINCGQCHYVGMDTPEEDWFQGGYESMDDTPKNRICLGCHNDTSVYNGKVTDKYKTHSSYQFSSVYEFSRQCIDCHNPHYQRHLRIYRSSAFINTGTMTGITADADPTVTLGTALSKDYENYMFIPNSKYYTLTYKIINSTDGKNSFKIRGPVNLTYAPAGSTYAIVYGRDAHETINGKAVKLFRREGANSLADGDETYDGVCEVCHTQTQHFRGDGSAPDQKHENLTGADASSGIYCIQCHSHTGGFAHGGGSGSDSCGDCHGKHIDHGGVGTYMSHATHTENDSHGVRGPKLGGTACGECHDTANFPRFKDGQDLAGTTACDPCHSKGGSYNGVDSTGNSIGAKDNWRSGVYIANSVPAEKERWCAGCHDTGTSVINSVSAPPVIGDETASYAYGIGYGYYKTGHGLDSATKYPFSGIMNGAGLECGACHDLSLTHIDGNQKTFPSPDCTPDSYRLGFRLSIVNASNPMVIPRNSTYGSANVYENTELCFSCHDSGPLLDQNNQNTNLIKTDGTNIHEKHLNESLASGARYNCGCASYTTCLACHNVHGSIRLAMVRDELKVWYYNPAIVTYFGSGPPSPQSLPLSASTGRVSVPRSSLDAGTCLSTCHFTSDLTVKSRTGLFQEGAYQPPVLSWTGDEGFANDGVNPDSGFANSVFEFRVMYSDVNNNPPASGVKLLVDTDDGDACNTPDSMYDMDAQRPGDTNYYNGKVYTKSLELDKGTLTFCYNASDASGLATGPAVTNQSVIAVNRPPELGWASWMNGFESDGVVPNGGTAGEVFTFKIVYTDANNDAPGTANLMVNGNPYPMTVLGGDTDYTDGAVYNATVNISPAGAYNYRFAFTDSDGAAATGQGITNTPLTVTDGASAPVLSWTGEAGYTGDGVEPDVNYEEIVNTFRVMYTDIDNSPASTVQAWIDINNSSSYDPDEKFAMSPVDASDTDYSDGKIYSFAKRVPFKDSGPTGSQLDLSYRFHAMDVDSNVATLAEPVTPGGSIGIINALTVGSGFEYATLQEAIDAASVGDTIVVSDGSYTNILINKNVDIISVNGPSVTDIYYSTSHPVVFNNNVTSKLSGFTVKDGTSYGVQMNSGSTPTIDNCAITNNGGDGIYGNNNTLATITNSVISDNARGIYMPDFAQTLTLTNTQVYNNNSTGSGGGIYAKKLNIVNSIINGNSASTGGAIAGPKYSNLTLSGSIINGNSTTSSGGALYFGYGSNITITGSNIYGNKTTGGYGGGIYAASDPFTTGSLKITGSTIEGNVASSDGGGINSSGANLYLTDSLVTGNTAGGWGGGGITTGKYMKLVNTTVSDNTAPNGGGIYAYTSSTTESMILNSTISGNTATATTSGGGGGIYITGGTSKRIKLIANTVISGNESAFNGGGMYVVATIDEIYNVNITGNKADNFGGGIYVDGTIQCRFCTLSGNAATSGGALYKADSWDDNSWFKDSIIYNNSSNQLYAYYDNGKVWVYNSLINQGAGFKQYTDMGGNISGPADFVNGVSSASAPTSDGDYHILNTSAAIDAASSGFALVDDLEGDTRPQGAGYDMGADEYVP